MSDHENSIAFYRMRLEQELTLAAKASSPAIRQIHEQMAQTYQRLIDERQVTGRQVQEPDQPWA
jgi:hypothetical protein